MTDLIVQNLGSDENPTLVVDSRICAEMLDVKHSDWLRNIVRRYQGEIEADFGKVRFALVYEGLNKGEK